MKTAFKELVQFVASKHQETYLFGFDATRHGVIPDKTVDFPVCEETIVGAALGAARSGAHVFVDLMFLPFIFRAFDVVVNQLCLNRFLNEQQYGSLTIRARCGPFEGAGPQHGNEVLSLIAEVPELFTIFPRFSKSVLPLYLKAQSTGKTLLLLEGACEMGAIGTNEPSSKKMAITVLGGYAPIVEIALNNDSTLLSKYFVNPIETLEEFYGLVRTEHENQLVVLPNKLKYPDRHSLSLFPYNLPYTWNNAVSHLQQQLKARAMEGGTDV